MNPAATEAHAVHPVQVHPPRPARYVAPASIDEALALLADPALAPARAVAGGTDLLIEIERGVRRGVATLVDLSRAPGAATVTVDGDVAVLGPLVTHNDVVSHPVLVDRALPLAQACLEVGSPQLRNRATVVGNLVTASPANDTISALLALGAAVELRSVRGSRLVDLDAFLTGFRSTVLAPDELVTAVRVPLLAVGEAGATRGMFVKVGNRSAQAISVLHVAAVVATGPDGVVSGARIALGSVAPRVVLAPAAAAALIGQRLTPETIARAAARAAGSVAPIDDVRASAEYRRKVLPVIVRRALEALAEGREAHCWPDSPPRLGRPAAGATAPRAGTIFDAATTVTTTLNGQLRAAPAAVGANLLDWLRDELGSRGTKEGCAEGECGACTVRLDGAAVMSCLVPAARADGADIVTVEGVGSAERPHVLQDAFIACTAVQCGFCTPGFVVAGAQLLEEFPSPTPEQVRLGLSGNLCRCTGYTSIVAAMERASASASPSGPGSPGPATAASASATSLPAGSATAPELASAAGTGPAATSGVGAALARADAPAKVTGAATYPADRFPAGALVAKVAFSNQPHARLVSLDLDRARAVPGVVAVFGAADVPVNEYGLTMFDQPVILGLGGTGRAATACDVSRWEADCLALVVAETAAAADAAVAAIEARWEPRPVLDGIDAALAPGAPLLHPENGRGSNVYEHYRIRKGDPDAAFASAHVVIEGTYAFPYQEHAYLQPEAALSYVDAAGRVTVEIAGQWAHEDQEQIAHALDLPREQVRVVYPAIGGAFGGREDMSLQILMALAAWRLAAAGEHRPISCRWSREESIIGHHKRHRGRVRARLAAGRDGRITAVEAEAYLDAGGYNYTTNKVLGNLHLGLAGCYEVPNARIDSRAVYTNGAIGGAFRGFGGPQATFVAETQMNRLAEALGMGPAEVRRRNVLRDGSIGITQTQWPPGVSLSAVLEECVVRGGFEQRFAAEPSELYQPCASLPAAPGALRRGRGLACAFKNIGYSFGFPERCEAEVRLHGPDGADSADRTDAADSGATADGGNAADGGNGADGGDGGNAADGRPGAEDGSAAEDGNGGGSTNGGGPSSGDITRVELFHAGAEVGQGSHQAMLQMTAEAVGVPVERVEGHFSDTATAGDSGSVSASRMTWMAGNAILGAAEEADKQWRDGARPAIGRFRFTPPPTEPLDPETGECNPNFAYAYVAQHVELTVDTETGHIAVERVVSVHDVGRAINPAMVVGQIDGGIVQAHGYVLSEDLVVEAGRVQNPRLSSYLIPGIGDTPRRIEPVVLELADPLGPWGARGLAELPFMTYAPAVVAALHDATGLWFSEFPLTPSRVLARLRSAGNGTSVGAGADTGDTAVLGRGGGGGAAPPALPGV